MAGKEPSLFDGDLWGTVEEENIETYIDANGNERKERVQSLPPPSLTRGGATSHSSHVLERHTGTFTARAVKRDSVPATPFDDTEVRAFTRPDTAPSSFQQQVRVQRNQTGVQAAPQQENAFRDTNLYEGYNLKDADTARKPRYFPVTNRSVEPESTWYSRAQLSSNPVASLAGSAPVIKKYGNIDVDSAVSRAKKSVLAHFENTVPKPRNIVSKNTAYDTSDLHSASKLDPHGRPARRAKIISGLNRPEHSSNDVRVTNVSSNKPKIHAGVQLTEGRDGNASDRLSLPTRMPTAAAMANNELSEETLYDDAGTRSTRNDVAVHLHAMGELGNCDSTQGPDAVRTLNNIEPTKRVLEGNAGLNPNRDSTAARQDMNFQPSVRNFPVKADVLQTTHPEIWDERNPIRNRTITHERGIEAAPNLTSKDATTVPRTGPGMLGSRPASKYSGLQRPLRDESARGTADPRQNRRLKMNRGLQGQARITDHDAFASEDAHLRVRDELQRTGPSGDTARVPQEELGMRPTVAPQASHWEMRGPAGRRDNVPRNMTRLDYHSNNNPLASGNMVNAVEPEYYMKPSGRETPTMAPIGNFASRPGFAMNTDRANDSLKTMRSRQIRT